MFQSNLIWSGVHFVTTMIYCWKNIMISKSPLNRTCRPGTLWSNHRWKDQRKTQFALHYLTQVSYISVTRLMLFQITSNFILCYSLYNSIIKVLVYDRCSGCSMRVFEFFCLFYLEPRDLPYFNHLLVGIEITALWCVESDTRSHTHALLHCDMWNPVREVTDTHCCTVIYGIRYEKSQTRIAAQWYMEPDTRSHRHALLNCDMWNPYEESQTRIAAQWYMESDTRSHRHALLHNDIWNPIREVTDTHCWTVICGIRYEKSQTRIAALWYVESDTKSHIHALKSYL